MPVRVPWVGFVTTVNTREATGVSMSEPVSVTGVGTPVISVTLAGFAMGGSLIGVTLSATVAGKESRRPSLSLKMKLSGPE